MSDYRGRRQDNRQHRDDYDRQDRRPYRSRSREDRRGQRNYDRSRSPNTRYSDRRGGGRNQRGSERDYNSSRRYDDRDRRRDRDYDRSASPQDNTRRPSDHGSLPSRPREDDAPKPKAKPAKNSRRGESKKDDPEPESMEEDGEVDDDEAAMQAMMGFSGFGSTKGKKVAGNDVGAVRKEKKTEYRQYMNRSGGFNRPLSPSR